MGSISAIPEVFLALQRYDIPPQLALWTIFIRMGYILAVRSMVSFSSSLNGRSVYFIIASVIFFQRADGKESAIAPLRNSSVTAATVSVFSSYFTLRAYLRYSTSTSLDDDYYCAAASGGIGTYRRLKYLYCTLILSSQINRIISYEQIIIISNTIGSWATRRCRSLK
jgi:hypothetical protein